MKKRSKETVEMTLPEFEQNELGPLMELFDFAGYIPASVYLESTAVKVSEACYRSSMLSPTRLISEEYLLNSKRNSLDIALPLGVFAFSSFGVRGSLALRYLREEESQDKPDETIALPPYQNVNAPLGVTIRSRRSVREMSGDTMPLQTLSTILFYGDGTTGDYPLASEDNDALPANTLGTSFVGKLRTAPSGGGLFPIYLYLTVQNVEGLEDGIYLYQPLTHSLKKILIFDEQTRRAFAAIADWGFNIDSSKVNVGIFYVYNLYENSRKYCDMGMTFGIIEAGEISENIHLICTALRIASCDIGGYEKVQSEKFLGIDGLSKHLVHLTIIGMA